LKNKSENYNNLLIMRIISFFLVSIALVLIVSCEKEKNSKFKPISVDLISPENETGNQPLNVTLKWKNLNSEIYKYSYYLYIGESATDLKIIDTIPADGSLSYESYECNFLKLNTKYYWKVVAIAYGKTTTDDEICAFTTTDKLPAVTFQNTTLVVYPYNYVYAEYSNTINIRLSSSEANSNTDGASNTEKLANDFETYKEDGFYQAAKHCYDLDAFGHDDWYLPAISELKAVCEGSATLSDQTYYWSSTEYNGLDAYLVHTGGCDSIAQNKYKQYTFRCVRKDL
jgi:hypothetical protein